MSMIIFTGPTLAAADASQRLTADYRPPARQGDVYRACLEQPKIIAIIDGYFESVPAVWHKEILYAMSQGIHVYGCASMGAIRAAELAFYGMQGIGAVYQQFVDGRLEDDDEVAIIHAPGELNYQPISEAMVNIRATLQSANDAGIIDQPQLKRLTELAKSCWYPQRSYAKLLSDATHHLSQETHQALATFIAQHATNIKRDDALALIAHLANNININELAAKSVDYVFVHTDAWEALIEQVKAEYFKAQNDINLDDLYNELKLQGRFTQLRSQAQARQITLNQARQHQPVATPEQMRSALLSLSQQQQCIENGQINFNKLTQWFKAQQLTPAKFDQLMNKQAQLNWVDGIHDDVAEEVLDILRLNNELGAFSQRIEAKKAATKQQSEPLTLAGLGISDEQLWQWYFQTRLQQPQPTDLVSFARSAGFCSVHVLHQAVMDEYHYCSQLTGI